MATKKPPTTTPTPTASPAQDVEQDGAPDRTAETLAAMAETWRQSPSGYELRVFLPNTRHAGRLGGWRGSFDDPAVLRRLQQEIAESPLYPAGDLWVQLYDVTGSRVAHQVKLLDVPDRSQAHVSPSTALPSQPDMAAALAALAETMRQPAPAIAQPAGGFVPLSQVQDAYWRGWADREKMQDRVDSAVQSALAASDAAPAGADTLSPLLERLVARFVASPPPAPTPPPTGPAATAANSASPAVDALVSAYRAGQSPDQALVVLAEVLGRPKSHLVDVAEQVFTDLSADSSAMALAASDPAATRWLLDVSDAVAMAAADPDPSGGDMDAAAAAGR